jgi:hypothetical protein
MKSIIEYYSKVGNNYYSLMEIAAGSRISKDTAKRAVAAYDWVFEPHSKTDSYKLNVANIPLLDGFVDANTINSLQGLTNPDDGLTNNNWRSARVKANTENDNVKENTPRRRGYNRSNSGIPNSSDTSNTEPDKPDNSGKDCTECEKKVKELDIVLRMLLDILTQENDSVNQKAFIEVAQARLAPNIKYYREHRSEFN